MSSLKHEIESGNFGAEQKMKTFQSLILQQQLIKTQRLSLKIDSFVLQTSPRSTDGKVFEQEDHSSMEAPGLDVKHGISSGKQVLPQASQLSVENF